MASSLSRYAGTGHRRSPNVGPSSLQRCYVLGAHRQYWFSRSSISVVTPNSLFISLQSMVVRIKPTGNGNVCSPSLLAPPSTGVLVKRAELRTPTQVSSKMTTPNRHEDAILTRNWNLSNASSWTVNFWKRPTTDTDEKTGTPTQDASALGSDAYFLEGLPLFAVIGALSLAVFMVAMDVNVIVTAVPRITNDLQSLSDIGWYGSAFLMTACVFQIPFGRFYSLFAIKFVFIAAVCIFMAGSLIVGLAPNSPVFILGRAVQGIGASGILSGGLIIMAEVIPVKIRPFVGAIIGALEGVAMISGPILGGVLTERLQWRWCFYINLPIAGLVLVIIVAFLSVPRRPMQIRSEESTWEAKIRRLDPIGFFFLLPSLVCLLLGIQYGGKSQLRSQDKTVGWDRTRC